MTSIANFDIATDLKVEIYLPNAASDAFILGVSDLGGTDLLSGDGTFIVGYSLLGGTDVLSDTSGIYAFIWEPVEATVSKLETSLGGFIQNNIYFQPEPGEISLQMQSWEYDPNNNTGVHAGARIRVRLDDGITTATLFSGFIETVNVIYRPEAPNQINIKAYDAHKRLVNSRITSWDTTSYGASLTPKQQIQTLATKLGYTVSSSSDNPAGALPTGTAANVISNTYLNDAIEVGLAVFWINPATSELEFRERPSAATGGATTYVIGNNHPVPPATNPYHLCMSDIKMTGDQTAMVNNLRVALESTPATYVVVKDQDSIDLYGEISTDISLNTTDSTALTTWANAAFHGMPAKIVDTVQTPAKDRTGNLTQAAFFTPGTLIGVNYTTSDITIVDYYTIVQVSHSVDVDTWFTTLKLWKEF